MYMFQGEIIQHELVNQVILLLKLKPRLFVLSEYLVVSLYVYMHASCD